MVFHLDSKGTNDPRVQKVQKCIHFLDLAKIFQTSTLYPVQSENGPFQVSPQKAKR